MNQADRDRKKAWKTHQKESAKKSFPLSDNLLAALFDFVDLSVGKDSCNYTRRFTEKWLAHNNVAPEPVLRWLESYGGFCDCEVIFNAMEFWEENR